MVKTYSTREAAKKLGVSLITLQRHVAAETFRIPALQRVEGVRVRLWSDPDIKRAQKKLAGVKPGRRKRA
jgi:hypothetical protein